MFSDERNILIFTHLHALLHTKKSIKIKQEQGKSYKLWKPSIMDSVNSTILNAVSVSDLQTKYITEFCKKYDELELKHQPVIGVVNNTYFIIFDNLMYPATSFLFAVDVIFKLFFVLNLKYPVESTNVWKFLESFFFLNRRF